MNQISGHYFLCIIEACKALGVSTDVIHAKIDVFESSLKDPMRRLDGDYLIDLYDLASTQLSESNIGLKIGQRFNVSWLNQTGKLLPVCETLAESGSMLARYHRLTQTFGTSQLEINGSFAILKWQRNYKDTERHKHVIVAIFTGIVIATKWLLLNESEPINFVQFRHSACGNESIYEDILGCPVYFERDVDAISIHSNYLLSSLVTANAEMKVEMLRKLDRLMFRLNDEESVIASIEASIREQLHDGAPVFSISAKHLNMNERVLREKLRKQSTSFRKLVKSVRLQICEIEMHKNTQISLIAHKLGFHDQSAFNHAFHNWFGKSPKEYQSLIHSAVLGAK